MVQGDDRSARRAARARACGGAARQDSWPRFAEAVRWPRQQDDQSEAGAQPDRRHPPPAREPARPRACARIGWSAVVPRHCRRCAACIAQGRASRRRSESDMELMDLSNLQPAPGRASREAARPRHRAPGTARRPGAVTRAAARARAATRRPGYEGGQMPLQRRLPKRGFTNPLRDDLRDRQPRPARALRGRQRRRPGGARRARGLVRARPAGQAPRQRRARRKTLTVKVDKASARRARGDRAAGGTSRRRREPVRKV